MTEFKTGDRVRISDPADYLSEWNGFEGVVVGHDSSMGAHIAPLSPRPDGHEYYPFFWTTDNLVLVEGEAVKEDPKPKTSTAAVELK